MGPRRTVYDDLSDFADRMKQQKEMRGPLDRKGFFSAPRHASQVSQSQAAGVIRRQDRLGTNRKG
jgi:hypothetical protein